MMVALLNLGDTPRVFYNRLGRAITCPVGKITRADLSDQILQGIEFSSQPETVLVASESMTEPPAELRGVLDVLHVLAFEGYEQLLRQFLEIIPPNNLTEMRPSRAQMRTMLKTMVEDYIASHRRDRDEGRRTIRDDVDPKQLEREAEYAERAKWQEPQHPLQKEQQKTADANRSGLQRTAAPEPVAARPPARAKSRRAGSRSRNP